ncbi:apoptotic chromatin condensation inducer 1b [Oryzias melastigma]|uniref:Apoptotic chromatin condensation inducer 1b n=2 Tax=Oryzias melastigma TaxID=30732 RepID=A0A3B3DKP0_ORYME|nr:apoptotic chromatin condensation inducer 1b [Oryzias melastigma]
MADEDITLDGKPLHSLRVADLKAALEQRNLPKSGQKNTLLKRLKGALMLENLQKSSTSTCGLQPNSQIGEEMCQNSFIKQYLAKQQELLRQRLEKEAQQEMDADDSPGGADEDDDHSEDNDSSTCASEKHQSILSQRLAAKAVEEEALKIGHGFSHALHQQGAYEAPGGRLHRANFQQGPKELPSPSRAVASLSVRVLGQPDCQGVGRPQEKEDATPAEPGSARPNLHLSRPARSSTGNRIYDDEEEEDDDDDSDNDDDWGPSPSGAQRGKRAPPPVAPSVPLVAARSKRKLQPPQHIPPPQVHHSPMQLRHPTPPPSPPPNLFPLPDTPKQSPPDTDHEEGEDSRPAQSKGAMSLPNIATQRQDSDSSSRSSSPEPTAKRRPGPLSLLVQKMETEEAGSATAMSEEATHSGAHCSGESPRKEAPTKGEQGSKQKGERNQHEEKEEKRPQDSKSKKTQEQAFHEEKESDRKLPEEEKKGEKAQLNKQMKKKQEKEEKMVVIEAQDSGSSSESDSKSDSSSRSSSSSSSSPSRDKAKLSTQFKKEDQQEERDEEKKTYLNKEKHYPPKREVSEPSTAAITEVEPDSESSTAQQPASGAEPESNESRLEEGNTPKAFAARKISLSSTKSSPANTEGGAGDSDTGGAAGRKRRWGSSTAVTAKKPSISITTDSLKSLIPDIKVNQDAVVDLHPDELQLSGDEENMDANRSDPDNGLKIRRTVTQVIPNDRQENGQTNEEEEEEVEKKEREIQRRPSRETRENSHSEEVVETRISVKLEEETKKVTPSDNLVRRSISQQKSGVSVTIDDPVRTARQPSPPRGKVSNIIHVTNLVRPFTLLQLKELLNRTGTIVEEGFWIDKIKSHCYVTYSATEEAVATREALHGVKWPQSNPKVLRVDFCEQDELDFHKGVVKPEKVEEPVIQPVAPPIKPPPLMPEHARERDRDKERERDRGVRDLWAERQREMERRERARGEREWDRDKIREFARPGEEGRRSRSRDRERRRRERAKSKERKSEKKDKADEPPAKMLDDLFLKTKAAPCIYWLPLTEEQVAQRLLDRSERQKERERKRKELEEAEDKKREEEKKERLKSREKDGGTAAGAGTAKRAVEGERVRDKEGEKRRDSSHRSRRPSPGAGSGRRSRSRSNPRDRRR